MSPRLKSPPIHRCAPFAVGILVSKKYDSSEPEELKFSPQDDIELVWVKIKTLGSNDLYIGSFYKPPGRSDPQYLDKLYSFITRIPSYHISLILVKRPHRLCRQFCLCGML
jgi:hypothetical protein